jgi:hypothetical protein
MSQTAIHGSDLTAADVPRLATQMEFVRRVAVGGWRSLAEISEAVETLSGKTCGESSVSAQLRNLRKPSGGGYIVEKKRVGNYFVYRVVSPAPVELRQVEMF